MASMGSAQYVSVALQTGKQASFTDMNWTQFSIMVKSNKEIVSQCHDLVYCKFFLRTKRVLMF